MTNNIEINNKTYLNLDNSPVIVICLDESQKEYLEEASKANL